MSDAIYFSKVQFEEFIGYNRDTHSILLLNLDLRELSYQVYRWKRQMPAITGETTTTFCGRDYQHTLRQPAKRIKNNKTGFDYQLLPDAERIPEIVFSYGIKLSAEDMEELLPYCNALDFEPYRDKEMVMFEEGYVGYRDEQHLYFTGITNSYIPMMEWGMPYYYDEAHIWPSEKLYRYLVTRYFKKDNKKLREWGPWYGAGSLFG